MATLQKFKKAWSVRPRKQSTKITPTKKRREKKSPVCPLESAQRILDLKKVFTEEDCPAKLKDENAEHVTLLSGRTIPISPSRLSGLRDGQTFLFHIPSGLSIPKMRRAHPEMFGDLSGLIKGIEILQSDELNPWNWHLVFQELVDEPDEVLLLIETIYVHIVYRLKTGKNFFSPAVDTYAEPWKSRVVVFFDDNGVVSIPRGNFLEIKGHPLCKML